jgi:transcriptional regulator with XRE-family HTH domain
MESKLRHDVQRRHEEMIGYYRETIGLKIKKRRMELQMTQETAGRGIISNTFISKLENNAIRASKECYLLLAERLDMSPEIVELPEEMIAYLNRAVECFYWNDRAAYQIVFDEVEKFEFAVLIQIVRLGYYVLLNNSVEATKIQTELYRYLTSLEKYAFSVFLLFGAGNLVQIHDYEVAEEMLVALSSLMQNDSRLLALSHYYQSVLYGNIQHGHVSEEAAEKAKTMFVNSGNYRRLMLIHVNRLDFSFAEHYGVVPEYLSGQLALLDPEDQDRYHLLLALSDINPVPYLDQIRPESELYPFGLFLRCGFHLKHGDSAAYESSKDQLKKRIVSKSEVIDFHQLLLLRENLDTSGYKEYIINTLYPYSIKIKNIRFIKYLHEEITRILTSKKRYKDACTWSQKIGDELKKIHQNKIKS